MPDKKLEKLKKLLEIANQDYATPEEVVKMSEALVRFVASQREIIEKKIAEVQDLSSTGQSTVSKSLEAKEQRINTLISTLNEKIALLDKRTSEAIKSSVSRVEKKIPTKVDLTDIKSEIQAIKDSLPDFSVLLTQEPEAIRDGLELLQGDERLDSSAIKGLEDYKEVATLARKPSYGGVRNLSALSDVNVQTTRPNENATIQYQNASGKWLTGVAITVSSTQPTDPKFGDIWVALP